MASVCRQKADGPVVELLNDEQIKTRKTTCSGETDAVSAGSTCTAYKQESDMHAHSVLGKRAEQHVHAKTHACSFVFHPKENP